jgi:hypothetical protein
MLATLNCNGGQQKRELIYCLTFRIKCFKIEIRSEMMNYVSTFAAEFTRISIPAQLHSLQSINPLKLSGYYMYHLLYYAKICILPTEYICVFRMVLNNKQRLFP